MDGSPTLAEVGEETLVLDFFLILMPGTGAELRASKKPVHSMAEEEKEEEEERKGLMSHWCKQTLRKRQIT